MVSAKSAPQRVLACIPLFFAIQQFSEGFVWLSLADASYMRWQKTAVYTFLVFAQVVWPVFVPLSMLVLEENKQRKKILTLLLSIGVMVGGYLLYCLSTYPVSASISDYHIRYDLLLPFSYKWYTGIAYIIPTVISSFVSSVRRMWLIGITIVLTCLISKIYYSEYLISVWCYFAAIISIIILSVIIGLNKKDTGINTNKLAFH